MVNIKNINCSTCDCSSFKRSDFPSPHNLRGAWSDDRCNTIGAAILEQVGMFVAAHYI